MASWVWGAVCVLGCENVKNSVPLTILFVKKYLWKQNKKSYQDQK